MLADGRFEAADGLDVGGRAPGERHAARLDADEAEGGDVALLLDDLVRHAHEGAVHLGRVNERDVGRVGVRIVHSLASCAPVSYLTAKKTAPALAAGPCTSAVQSLCALPRLTGRS